MIYSNGIVQCVESQTVNMTVVGPFLSFCIVPPDESDYSCSAGLYHFRIVLPPSYPMSAPDIILLTPNGRFELGKKVSRGAK